MWLLSWLLFFLGAFLALVGVSGLLGGLAEGTKGRHARDAWKAMLGTLVIGIAAVSIAYAIEPAAGEDAQREANTEQRAPSRGMAKQMAERFVRRRINRPSTAEFSGVIDTEINRIDDNTFGVRGWVEAENGFGATDRLNYGAQVSKDSGGWTLDEISID